MARRSKSYHLPADKIRQIAPDRGSCVASDLILVDGHRVGYMYRESPDDEIDSGWRFFSGLESQEYTDNAENFAMYDVNTLANYDAEIVPLLDAAVGAAFERDSDGQFTAMPFPSEPDGP
jgi:hypothetical protein